MLRYYPIKMNTNMNKCDVKNEDFFMKIEKWPLKFSLPELVKETCFPELDPSVWKTFLK